MATLRILLQHGSKVKELELSKDQVVTLGRSSKATFQAAALGAIYRRCVSYVVYCKLYIVAFKLMHICDIHNIY